MTNITGPTDFVVSGTAEVLPPPEPEQAEQADDTEETT